MIRIPRLAAALLVVASLAACSAPHDGPGGAEPGSGQPDPQAVDPWTADDLDTDAGVVTGEFMGVALQGFTCDAGFYVDAESFDGDIPRASVGGTTGASGIDYQDAQGISTALGPGLSLGSETVTVATDEGYWYIGDGGENTPWTPTAQLTVTAVPVPVDGCNAADLWAAEMLEVRTDPVEMVRAFTEDGLVNVSTDPACVEQGLEWVPPNVACDEFWDRLEATY